MFSLYMNCQKTVLCSLTFSHTKHLSLGLRGGVWICLTGGEFWASGGGWHQDSLGGCLLLLLLLLLEPLPGVHHLMTQDDTSLFLVLLVELQIEIQYNTIHRRWSGSDHQDFTTDFLLGQSNLLNVALFSIFSLYLSVICFFLPCFGQHPY